jgi:ribonuclease HI
VAIKALDNFQINSKLVWDCLQSMVKLADHNRMQLVWMPVHMGIDGNEIADQVAKHHFSHSLIQPKLVCGTSV